MGASPSDPDESGPLTPWKRPIPADIDHEFRASDAQLDTPLNDCALRLPPWLMWMGRAALTFIPLVLLLPFAWWSSIGCAELALAATIIVFKHRLSSPSRRGGGPGPSLPRGRSPRHP
jgi:hypothetical protein